MAYLYLGQFYSIQRQVAKDFLDALYVHSLYKVSSRINESNIKTFTNVKLFEDSNYWGLKLNEYIPKKIALLKMIATCMCIYAKYSFHFSESFLRILFLKFINHEGKIDSFTHRNHIFQKLPKIVGRCG